MYILLNVFTEAQNAVDFYYNDEWHKGATYPGSADGVRCVDMAHEEILCCGGEYLNLVPYSNKQVFFPVA
jgi:hypothetical protein